MNSLVGNRVGKISPLFIWTVIVPTFFAVIYFGFLAPDIYISEARFVIRSPEKQGSSALGALLKTPGVSVAGDEVFAVQEYVQSRDALRALDRDKYVRDLVAGPRVDWIARALASSWSDSFESQYRFFKRHVDVTNESTSSISVMKIRAYDPKVAFELNKHLLNLGEALVNRLNNRSREDLIGYARAEVVSARKESQQAAIALAAFRNKNGIVDPDKQSSIQLASVSKLQDELISTKAQLVQVRTFTPQNPQIPVLEARVESLRQDIKSETSKIAGGGGSLAQAAVEYQRVDLENQFADRQLASAMASLQNAKDEARRKQVYLERVVEPNMPDEPEEPKRLRNIFSVFVLGVVAWGVFSMLLAGLREHRD